MLTDEEMYERMANGWRAGRPETVCGNGSMLENTVKIRAWLPDVVKRFGIWNVCDAGAGDQWWVAHMKWGDGVHYTAFDLIPRAPRWGETIVHRLDITREAMPKCDAILCRMVLNHLDESRRLMALALFKKSARYLIATQFDGDSLPQRSRQFHRLDLRVAPYDLGEPIEGVQDGAESICRLALWQL